LRDPRPLCKLQILEDRDDLRFGEANFSSGEFSLGRGLELTVIIAKFSVP
jgi:hypothetical protein